MFNLMLITEIMARSGGGGSGGGDGGGGEIIALIGYFPSYYLGKLIKKLLPRTAELVVSATFAALCSIVLLIIGITGGLFGTWFMILVIIGIWAGWGAAFFGIMERLKKRQAAARQAISTAALQDSAWNEESLLAHARQTFLQYQYDWSTFNTASIQTYTSPRYMAHSSLLLSALRELGRTNVMAQVEIKNSLIVGIHDDPDNARDSFEVAFEASALDQLVDSNNTIIFKDTKPFIEYWHFIRSGESWLLDSIVQHTQDLSTANHSLRQFAENNHMFYSLDMGWLLLPSNGLLMSRGKLGTSDINNHVVGTYNGRLVQLYTYTPVPGNKNNMSWLVLQVTLPKSYGGIITQPRKKIFSSTSVYQKPPKSYKKYEFEWNDFNKRYSVHATDADRLAAFELINPGFMAYLYDNDPNAGIEVADNVLYLYRYLGARTTTTVHAGEYEVMLTIALKAFKELQL